ncbi:hypothetical protein D3C81_1481870 [compost metagenome]
MEVSREKHAETCMVRHDGRAHHCSYRYSYDADLRTERGSGSERRDMRWGFGHPHKNSGIKYPYLRHFGGWIENKGNKYPYSFRNEAYCGSSVEIRTKNTAIFAINMPPGKIRPFHVLIFRGLVFLLST